MSIRHTDFTKFGLDDKEARVYHAALSLGKATAEQIAIEAGILRTTTYHQIEALMDKGLMTTVLIGKKRFYIPESPTNLHRLLATEAAEIEKNQQLLTNLLPELTTLFSKNGARPAVRQFIGKEGLISMREEVLQMDGKELRIITAYDAFAKVFNEKERQSYTKRRIEKGITIRALYQTSGKAGAREQMKRHEVRPLPKAHLPLGFDVYLFDDKVCLSSLVPDDIWGIMISGGALNQSMSLLFEIAWQAADTTA